jgi:hypothetical protein
MARLLFFLAALFASPLAAQTPLSQSAPFAQLRDQALNFTGSGVGAVKRTRDEKDGDVVSIFDFCRKSQSDGVADNTACIQAAVTNRCVNGGGTIRFPAGRWAIYGTVTANCPGVHIEGSGFGDLNVSANRATFIRVYGSGDAPVFKFVGTPTTGINDVFRWQAGGSVSNLTMFQDPGLRTGAFITFIRLQQTRVQDVYMWAPCIAIKHDGGFMGLVENVIAESLADSCGVMVLTGTNNPGETLDVVRYQNVKVNAGVGAICFRVLDRVQSAWWVNTICQTGGKALEISCPTMTNVNACPGFFTLYDFESESFNSAFSQIDITDMVDGFKMTDGWLRGYFNGSAVAHNISITPSRFPASQQGFPITIANNWIKHAGGSCLYIQSERASITGNHIYGCGRLGGGPAFGAVEVRASYAAITGNTLCGADFLNDTVGMPAGITITNGADYVTATGNIFMPGAKGCTAAISGTATHSGISGNVGP